MTTNPALFKLLDSNPESFDYKGYITTWIISDGLLTKEEIESLRKENEADLALGGEPFIANFLPDGERPAHVKNGSANRTIKTLCRRHMKKHTKLGKYCVLLHFLLFGTISRRG